MNIEALREQLAQATRWVMEGEQQLADQRRLLAKLGRDGQIAAMALGDLMTLEQWQEMRVAERDRMRDALDDAAAVRMLH